MSKVKKLQTGGTAPQMNGLKFKVNNKDYELDQEMLDAEFQDAINKGIEQGSIKQEDINKYQNIYTNWKDQAKTGKYSIDRRGESFGDMKFEGQPGANIGLTKEGQVGKPSWLRRNVLGQNIDTSDDTQIMAHINSMMGNAIAKHSAVLDKEQTDKLTKEREEADKAKSEKIKKYGESKFDIFNVMYSGRPDITRQSALTYNWQRLSDKERRNFMMDYYNKLGKTVFDVNYDDPEVMKKLQDRGIDLAAIRGEFTKHGWKEGQFGKDFKGFGGQKSNLMQLLGTNIIDDEWFNKQAVSQQSGSTGTGTGTGTETSGTSTTTPTTTPAVQQQFAKGRGFYTTLNKAGEREYVLRGKRLSAQELYNYLKSKPNDAFASNIRSAISQGISAEDRAYGYDPSTEKYGIYHNISESTVPFTARNSQFVFDKGFKGIAANITSLFSNIGKGDKAHVIEYAVPDVFGSRTSKYMIVTPKGRQEGTIYINGAGESIFRTKSGEEVNLGKKMSKLQGNVPTHEFSPFSKGIDTSGRNVDDPLGATYRMKDGGTIRKFQIGGTAVAFKKQPKQEFQQHKATMAEAFAPGVSMSTADKAALTGLAFDTAGLVASLTGVGSVAGAGLGLAGSASTLVSDITRDGFQWGDVGNFAASAGMDVLSAVPGLGIGAKAGKLAKGVRAAQKVLMPLLIGAGAKSAADVVGKIARGEDVTIQDWRNLASGLHGLVGGVSMAKNIAGTKRATSNFIEANVGGKKQKFQLDEKDLSEINSGKTDADKIELAKLKISEKYNIENPDDIKLDQKLGLKFGLNPFTRTERFKIGTQKGEYQLKDIKQYEGPGIKNMIMRGVVTSAAAQNPNMPGARDIVGEDFNLLGTLGYRARIGKSDDAASAVVGSMRRFSLQPGSLAGQQPVSTTVQRALPIGQTRTPFNVDDEIAGAMSAGRKQSALERQTTESNVQTEEAAARKWETTKAKAKETKQAKAEAKSKEERRRFDIESKVKRGKEKEASRKELEKTLVGKQTTKVTLGGKTKRLTKDQMRTLQKIKPENRTKFFTENFKKGGVLKAQYGDTFSNINKKFNIKRQFIPGQPVIQSNINLSQPELTTTQYKAPSAINIPKIDISNIGKTYTPKSTGVITDTKSQSIFKPVVEKISGFAKKIDPVQLSEFARAAAMSAINRGVDTRVTAPLLQQTTEVPMSVKGNPLAKFAARNIGSNIMLQTRGSQGSDATLNRIAGLQASKQAGDIEFQGALQDADSQSKQEAMNLDAQMRYAAGRSDVANRNIAAQAQAENMEREAKNVKSQMIYQPFDVFWANLNKQRMMKDYISKANRSQMRFNELTQPMSESMVGAKSEYDNLYSEMNRNPEEFRKDPSKVARLNELEKHISRFETDVKNLGLQLEMDPDYTPSKKIFRLPTSSNIRTSGRILQKGGIIEKVNKDMRKTKEKTLSEFAKKSLNLSTYKDDLKQLSLNIKHINDLEKLIFKK